MVAQGSQWDGYMPEASDRPQTTYSLFDLGSQYIVPSNGPEAWKTTAGTECQWSGDPIAYSSHVLGHQSGSSPSRYPLPGTFNPRGVLEHNVKPFSPGHWNAIGHPRGLWFGHDSIAQASNPQLGNGAMMENTPFDLSSGTMARALSNCTQSSFSGSVEGIHSPGNVPLLDRFHGSTCASSPASVSTIATPKFGLTPVMEVVDFPAIEQLECGGELPTDRFAAIGNVSLPVECLGFPLQEGQSVFHRNTKTRIQVVRIGESPSIEDVGAESIMTESHRLISKSSNPTNHFTGPGKINGSTEGPLPDACSDTLQNTDLQPSRPSGEKASAIEPFHDAQEELAQPEADTLNSVEVDSKDGTSEDEDESGCASSRSRSPSPWLERWYEEGMKTKLTDLAAKLTAEYNDRENKSSGFNIMASEVARSEQHEVRGVAFEVVEERSGGTSTGSSKSKKRDRRDSSSEGDEEDDEGPRKPKKQKGMEPPESVYRPNLMYACPYQKRHPTRSPICGLPHGAKQGFGWETVSRVKQHLIESHGKDHHCPNCWKAFKKVKAAQSCKQERNCTQRPCPNKMWLSDNEIALLRAEKVQNRGDGSWYRLFALLFPEEVENGPEGYRARYTPYYSMLDESNKCSLLSPPNGVTPNSMWSPSTNQTPNQLDTATTPAVPQEIAPTSGATEEESWMNGNYFTNMLGGIMSTDGMADDASQMLSEQVLANDGLELGVSMNDCILNPSTTMSIPENRHNLRESSSSSQEDSHPKSLLDRLRQRNCKMAAENEMLRDIIDKIRATVKRQDGFMQLLDEGNLISKEHMGTLWGYQDELQNCVQFRG